MYNSRRLVVHEIEYNVYRAHVERMQLDMCDLGRTKVILDMPWLVLHNLEINWEKGEVKMTKCFPSSAEKGKATRGSGKAG